MGWFRKKQKEMAETFVDDATEKLQTKMKSASEDYFSKALKILPLVVVAVDLVISQGTGNVPEVSTSSKKPIFILNNGTVNIYK